MASQVQTITEAAQDKVHGYTSDALSTVDASVANITEWGQGLLDRFFPPEQRAAVWARLQEFMLANPKLSAFLGMNIALTGIPLGIFVLFSFTVALFSMIGGVMLGLLGAFLFTLFWVGLALSIVFPVVFLTTMTACFLFLWGMGGYYLLRWLNGTTDADGKEGKPLLASGSIGDSLNSLTGGRLTGFMNQAKAKRAREDITGFSDEDTRPKPPVSEKVKSSSQPNGSSPPRQKRQQSVDPSDGPSKSPDIQKVTKVGGVSNAPKTATNTAAVAKGGLSGATGLP